MLVKLVDETIQIANMPDDEAIEKGYKLAVLEDKPNVEPGFRAVSYWTEEQNTYTQHWDIVISPPDPDPDVDDAEAFDIIFGGAE